MAKKIACDKCGKVHVDQVHKTCKGYICSDCVMKTWGNKSIGQKESVKTIVTKMSISDMLTNMKGN